MIQPAVEVEASTCQVFECRVSGGGTRQWLRLHGFLAACRRTLSRPQIRDPWSILSGVSLCVSLSPACAISLVVCLSRCYDSLIVCLSRCCDSFIVCLSWCVAWASLVCVAAAVSNRERWFGCADSAVLLRYDTVRWMFQFGDPDLTVHLCMAQLWGWIAISLADSPVLPFNFVE